jgi:hypothetical protein
MPLSDVQLERAPREAQKSGGGTVVGMSMLHRDAPCCSTAACLPAAGNGRFVQ